MRQPFFAGLFVLVAASVTAQPPAPKPAPAELAPAPKSLVLSGCIAQGATPSELTFADLGTAGKPSTYRVTGTNLRQYVGRRVEITGNFGTTRVRVKGGLVPSPNTAAQAGAVDPARAATAGSGGFGAGTGSDLPEFRVQSVKSVPGSCPTQQ